MTQLSQRAQAFPASPIRKLGAAADAAKARGVTVHHLNIGQPDVRTPKSVIAAYQDYRAEVLAYGPSQGLPALREAVAAYYAALPGTLPSLSIDDVHVTVGGSEALLFAIWAITDPGDELVVIEPYYANYAGLSVGSGVTLRSVRADPAAGYPLPDDEQLRAVIGPRTRGIIITSPGNPTGAVYTPSELARLGALAEAHDLFVISDEVYREFSYERATAPSALEHIAPERVVVIDSVSKRFSACGARVGFLLTKNDALSAAVRRMGFARLCPATVDQLAALAAYREPQAYVRSTIDEYRRRRDVLMAGLAEMAGASATTPAGAFYAFVTLPVDDADRFCAWLLDDFQDDGETVMLAPGSGFYLNPADGQKMARIAYVLEQGALERCMQILARALAAYPGRD